MTKTSRTGTDLLTGAAGVILAVSAPFAALEADTSLARALAAGLPPFAAGLALCACARGDR